MNTETNIKTVSFAEIVDYAKSKEHLNNTRFSIISYFKGYLGLDKPKELVLLKFTLSGDYVGSTVERSNYQVLSESLKQFYSDRRRRVEDSRLDELNLTQDEFDCTDIWDLNPSYYRYQGGHSSQAIAIIGDLPRSQWLEIKECIEQVQEYPLLDDDHHSSMQLEECYESWFDWQFDDISSTLSNKYDIDLDEPELEVYAKKQGYENEKVWLWNIINDCELIPASDNIEILEINARAYYDFDTDNQELMEQIASYIRNL